MNIFRFRVRVVCPLWGLPVEVSLGCLLRVCFGLWCAGFWFSRPRWGFFWWSGAFSSVVFWSFFAFVLFSFFGHPGRW